MAKSSNLIFFEDIIDRGDFSHIVNNFEAARIIIRENVRLPDKKENKHEKVLSDFYNNLESFCAWLNTDVHEVAEGFALCDQIILWARKMLAEESYKRFAISSGYCRKQSKAFIYGLSRIYQGLRASFDPFVCSTTGIQKDQFARFMLDKNVGYGMFFEFNTAGGYAPATRVFSSAFSRRHMIELLRVLKLREHRENGLEFRCWGSHGSIVRVHIVKRALRKTLIYRVYRANVGAEHNHHERDLFRRRVRDFRFSAA